jgi:hypothetical protein
MKSLPKIGLYISTKKAKEMRLCVTETYGDEPEDFYTVNWVNESGKNDMSAMGEEYDNDEWEELVEEHGLEFQG